MVIVKKSHILILFLASCFSQDSDLPEQVRQLENLTIYTIDEEPASEIHFIREQTYGDKTEILIGDISFVVIDDYGRVFIADNQTNTIHSFDFDGNYVTSMGTEGKGPGEFQNFYDLQVYNDQLYVYDYTQQRISVFSLDSFLFSHIIELKPGNWNHIQGLENSFPTHFSVWSADSLLMRFTEISSPDRIGEPTYNRYYLMNHEGEIISESLFKERGAEYLVSRQQGGSNLLNSPVMRHSLTRVSDSGLILSAWTEDFLIQIYDEHGDYIRAFYYPYPKSRVNRQDIYNLYHDDFIEQSHRNADYPHTWPALHHFLLDNNQRIWIATISDVKDYYTWWILDEHGKLLARFDWAGKRLNRVVNEANIIQVINNYMYTLETDEETGLQQIVRYRIEMTES